MTNPFFSRLDVIYHCAKFGEDRTTRAGCKCENMVFVYFFYVTLRFGGLCVRGVHSSNVAVYGSILIMFPEGIALSESLHSLHIRR